MPLVGSEKGMLCVKLCYKVSDYFLKFVIFFVICVSFRQFMGVLRHIQGNNGLYT